MCLRSHPGTPPSFAYHYIRARGLGGDGPKDIISSVSAEFVVALRKKKPRLQTEN